MINGMRVCAYIWLAFYILWLLAALRTKRAVQQVDWGKRFTYTLPVLLGYYCMFGMDLDVSWLQKRILPKTQELAIAAIVITVGGWAFAVWARVDLGRNWSSVPTVKEQHQLIRSGPYRLVRHPIYSGLLLATAGTFLANGRVRGALAVVLVLIGWLIKSRMEEEFMVNTFGAEYDEYRRTTGALFPRIQF